MPGDEAYAVEENQKKIMEALLFTAPEPVPLHRIANYLNLPLKGVLDLLSQLSRDYQDRSSGIQVTRVGEGVRLETSPAMAPHIQAFHHPPKTISLAPATLETLAIIAYRQPITRGEIESIRGVKVEKSLMTLKRYQLIEEKGRREGPGKPILYGTGEPFLQYFGLQSLSHLPPLPKGEDGEDREKD